MKLRNAIGLASFMFLLGVFMTSYAYEGKPSIETEVETDDA